MYTNVEKKNGMVGMTVDFKSNDLKNLAINDYLSSNSMHSIFNTDIKKFHFDIESFRFTDQIIKHLIDKEILLKQNSDSYHLDHIHANICSENMRLDDSEQNKISKLFYEADHAFLKLYNSFIENIICSHFSESFYFQKTPTLRFHFPNQEGFNWHPTIHNDIMLGHPPKEINIWLPFTKTFGSNSMIIAPLDFSLMVMRKLNFDYGKFVHDIQMDEAFRNFLLSNMKPLELKFGEGIFFDSRCLHATQYNTTDSTRVSMDIRIISEASYKSLPFEYVGTGRMKMPFTPGNYYSSTLIKPA